ncbi:hypothetical protein [Diaphorobacter ruginosibacter]|uniref:hypothetical protein n=1 Tax=Diaphorobacter ruginosibacter TaxID=1715720 RepID=UPI00333F4BBA
MTMRMGRSVALGLGLLAGAAGLMTGCVQMPTEKHAVASLKPQISFQFAAEHLAAARVRIDGLPVGSAGQFRQGEAALQIEPGTHLLQVDLGGQMLLNEKFYVGSSVLKTFDIR